MIVNVNGQKLKIRFMHDLPTPERVKMGKTYPKNNGGTSCMVSDVDKPETEFVVDLKCYYKDTFKKSVGRKYALTEALRWLFPDDKIARTIVWKEYFKTHKK